MSLQALGVLILLAATVALLIWERLRPDLVAMLALAAALVFRLVTVEEALSGFSNPATVTVAAMFLLSAGLKESGLIQLIGDRMLRGGPYAAGTLLIVSALVIGPVSAFINNTAAVAIFLPLLVRACQGRVNPSRVLMPLSFFAMLGGMCTLIGTSTNVLVSSLASARGLEPFSMFEFTAPGALIFVAGTVFILLFGRVLLPERVPTENLTEDFHLNRYLSEVVVLPGSPLAGSTLVEAQLGARYDLEVLALVHPGGRKHRPHEVDRLQEGDLLLVKAPAASLLKLRDNAGIAVKPGRHPDDADLRSADTSLFEAVVTPNSQLDGRTLKGVDFRHRYGATTLAIRRHGEEIREKIGKVRLKVGDELLILAPTASLDRLRSETDFVMLQELEVPVLIPRQAVIATTIVTLVVAVAASGLYPIATTALVGSVLMVVSGCIPVRKIYREVDWKVIFLLAGLIPMGIALETSGAAARTVDLMVEAIGAAGPHWMLAAFFLLSFVLTGFMSNTATAALLTPLAIVLASRMGVDARPFLVALAFAASAAFYTPIGYQTNLLVYGPGGYRFADFLRLGGPLNVVVWALATLLIPIFFPF